MIINLWLSINVEGKTCYNTNIISPCAINHTYLFFFLFSDLTFSKPQRESKDGRLSNRKYHVSLIICLLDADEAFFARPYFFAYNHALSDVNDYTAFIMLTAAIYECAN